ncbi:hypothetical protein Taro_041402 [Colocasia esculenta]|uniref:EF-hand domain-containing protein n=1 Tax=Colocasia esculenta TaxID=4460 RepID=A0A843WPR9_COLES|nr:hypothetical protein [Colocasia esculenta]
MKLISSFFSSSSASSSSKKKKKGSLKDRSMSRSDTPSFGSSASSGRSDSFTKVTARGTPRTVIIGRNASGLDAEYWSSTSPGRFAPKGATGGVAAPVAHAAAVPAVVSELFGVFDRDGDGKITKQELELVLRRLGRSDPPSEEEVAMMVAEVDRDGDGCISLDEFRALGPALGPSPAWGTSSGAPGVEELRDAFAIFDADGNGKISAEELLRIFLTLGDETCTLDDCRRMIGGVDSSGDGCVCFDDFVRMMDGQR